MEFIHSPTFLNTSCALTVNSKIILPQIAPQVQVEMAPPLTHGLGLDGEELSMEATIILYIICPIIGFLVFLVLLLICRSTKCGRKCLKGCSCSGCRGRCGSCCPCDKGSVSHLSIELGTIKNQLSKSLSALDNIKVEASAPTPEDSEDSECEERELMDEKRRLRQMQASMQEKLDDPAKSTTTSSRHSKSRAGGKRSKDLK